MSTDKAGNKVQDVAEARVIARPKGSGGVKAKGLVTARAYRGITSPRSKLLGALRRIMGESSGGRELLWEENNLHNLVVNVGLDYLLDVALSGATQITTWYIGLTDGTPTLAAADTMASHAGWVEVTAYTEAVRQTWVDGGVSGQSVSNSASVASFSINATTTVGGVFMASDNVKAGTTGTLYSEVAFSADRSLQNGDTLEITYTQTSADDGV